MIPPRTDEIVLSGVIDDIVEGIATCCYGSILSI
jgi:hypothetical protein